MSSDGPEVSVIVTYHNEGELLRRALASIDGQTYRGALEVVVVDDASELRPVVSPGGRLPVRVVRSERPIHAGAARNLGLGCTRGEYVCYLDADDEFLPGKIECQVAFLREHPDVAVVGGPYHVHRDGKEWLQVPDVILECFPELRDRECVLPEGVRHATCFHFVYQLGAATFRRGSLERLGGFDATYGRWGDDWDLWVRIAQGGKIGYVPEPASRYIGRGGSITTTADPEKFLCGAGVVRKWRRMLEGLTPEARRALRAKQREWHLLAAQALLEDRGHASRALAEALRSLACGPSAWGVRSVVKSVLRLALPSRGRRPGRLMSRPGRPRIPDPAAPRGGPKE